MQQNIRTAQLSQKLYPIHHIVTEKWCRTCAKVIFSNVFFPRKWKSLTYMHKPSSGIHITCHIFRSRNLTLAWPWSVLRLLGENISQTCGYPPLNNTFSDFRESLLVVIVHPRAINSRTLMKMTKPATSMHLYGHASMRNNRDLSTGMMLVPLRSCWTRNWLWKSILRYSSLHPRKTFGSQKVIHGRVMTRQFTLAPCKNGQPINTNPVRGVTAARPE